MHGCAGHQVPACPCVSQAVPCEVANPLLAAVLRVFKVPKARTLHGLLPGRLDLADRLAIRPPAAGVWEHPFLRQADLTFQYLHCRGRERDSDRPVRLHGVGVNPHLAPWHVDLIPSQLRDVLLSQAREDCKRGQRLEVIWQFGVQPIPFLPRQKPQPAASGLLGGKLQLVPGQVAHGHDDGPVPVVGGVGQVLQRRLKGFRRTLMERPVWVVQRPKDVPVIVRSRGRLEPPYACALPCCRS